MKNLSKVLALSLAIILALGLAASAAVPTYFGDSVSSDVTADEKLAIDVLGALKMSAGTVAAGADAKVNLGGTFNPNAILTRAEAVTFICNAISGETAEGLKVYATYADKFTDLAGYEWAKPFIGWAVSKNITAGTGNGKFSPAAKLTVIQALGLIANAHGLNNEKDGVKVEDWKNAVFSASVELKLGLKARTLAYDSEVTRKEMALFVYNSLSAKSYTYTVDYTQLVNGTSVPRYVRKLDVPGWSDSNNLTFIKDGTITANQWVKVSGSSASADKTRFNGVDVGPQAPFNYVGRKATAIVLNSEIVGYSLGGKNEIFTSTDKVSFDGNKINFGNGVKEYKASTVEKIDVLVNFDADHDDSDEYTPSDLATLFKMTVNDIICITNDDGYVTDIYLLAKTFTKVLDVKTDDIVILKAYNSDVNVAANKITVSKKTITGDISGLKKDDNVLYYQLGSGDNTLTSIFRTTTINDAKATLGTGTSLIINGTTYKQGYSVSSDYAARADIAAKLVNKATDYVVFGDFYFSAKPTADAAPNYAVITKVEFANIYRYGSTSTATVIADMLFADGNLVKGVYINSAKNAANGDIAASSFYGDFNGKNLLVTYTKVDGADAYNIKLPTKPVTTNDTAAVVKGVGYNTLDSKRLDSSSILFAKTGDDTYKVFKTSNITGGATVKTSYITKSVEGQLYTTAIDVAFIDATAGNPFGATATTTYAVVAGEVKVSDDGKTYSLPVRLDGPFSNGIVDLKVAYDKTFANDLFKYSEKDILKVKFDGDKVLTEAPSNLTNTTLAASNPIASDRLYSAGIYAVDGTIVTFITDTGLTKAGADFTSDYVFDADVSKLAGNKIYFSDSTGYPTTSKDDADKYKKNITIILKSGKTIASANQADLSDTIFNETVDAIIIW